ncbi:DUF1207 domain-containing protein [Gemmatimonadota bacterium]
MSHSHSGFTALLSLVACLAAPIALAAQGETRFFPSQEFLARVIAAPHSPVTGAKLVYNSDGPSEFGNTVEGEVALAASLPLYLIAGSGLRDGLVVGAEGAVFGRFTLTTITRDLISTDWIFAVPFIWHLGEHWLRFGYHHTSAHIGDEYIARFDAEVADYSRDVTDFTAFYQATESVGLYGGGNWAFNVHPTGSRRLLVRAGAQAETRNTTRALLPYGAVDVQWEQNNSWEPRLNVQVGVRLPKIGGRRSMRLAMEFLAGPSPQGQFHEEHVRQVTLGLFIDP